MKILHLSVITKVPNEEGEKLIEKAVTRLKPKKDEEGLSRRWFEEQGLRVPKHLEEDDIEMDDNGTITLQEEHMQTIIIEASVPLKNVDIYVESVDEGSILYTKSGQYYNVAEEVWEIDNYIEMLNMGWWEKEWIILKEKFRRLKNKITGKKEVDLEEILNRPENNPNN